MKRRLGRVSGWLGAVCLLLIFVATTSNAAPEDGWFAFEPPADAFAQNSVIDLRCLNEKFAGEHGFIAVRNSQFICGSDALPVRFWAVNGPPHDLTGAELKRCARLLAKYGVNLVRVHGGYFNKDGEVDETRIQHAFEIVEAMKADGEWLSRKYGSLDQALAKWHGLKTNRDAFSDGRVGFRPLWNISHDKTARDQDTAEFLLEVQTRFYAETYAFLRGLGFKGVITASNWATASPEVFGPLEKLSYTAGDFIDRHGYFSCNHKGPSAEWSLRDGHTYSDRSALRFDPEDPAKPKQFVHPAMDPHYDGKPSMISETTWNRPNRFRSEAPLYLAAYGALQHSDAIVHFAFDGARWSVKPAYWMQPWTLMSPAMLGQFPAAALIYRRGLVSPGRVLAEIQLNQRDLLALKGTPLPQDAALDELRLKDIPAGAELKPGGRLDPLLHYAGRTEVKFTSSTTSVSGINLRPFIDHAAQTVTSSTGELKLDYGKGLLILDAPSVQGISGALRAAGLAQTKDLTLSSDMELGHLVAVSLDEKPLALSDRILLQVMSEEKTSGFKTESISPTVQRITSIGRDPWLVKELTGRVVFKRVDASSLKVTALDFNGYPQAECGTAQSIELRPATLYYLISR